MKQTRLINQIVGGSYEADERIAGCAVSQNLYAENVEAASNGFYFTSSLRSVPGERVALETFVNGDLYLQNCRGIFVASNEKIFAAFGNGVYVIEKSLGIYSASKIFEEVVPKLGRVRFCETGGVNSHVCWVNGSTTVYAYPIDPEKAVAAGFTPPLRFITPLRQYKTADQVINDTEERISPDHICSINGSLIINDPATDTWYYTDPYILGGVTYEREIYDLDASGNVQYEGDTYTVKTRTVKLNEADVGNGTSYLWLDRYSKPHFTTASYSADRVTALVASGDFLFAFGTSSIQVYTQSLSTDAQGFSSMVFESSGRNYKDIGCKAVNSIVELNGNVVFLGSAASGERSVWYTNGGNPVRISTNAIERMMDKLDISDAYALGWMENGHVFYALTVPALDRTFVYDFSTSQWHNRSTYRNDSTEGLWWPEYAVSTYGRIFLAGKTINKLIMFDKDKYDDYKDDPIVKRRTAPVITNDYSEFMVNDLMLLWNNGTTKDMSNENGARDPVVMLEVSRDGGNTYDDEMWGMGGQTGQYGFRTVWYGIGAGTMFVFRFTISDRVNVVITGAKISYTPLGGF